MLGSVSSSVIFAGWLVGSLLGGFLSDKIGRKPVMIVFLFLCSLFGAIGASPKVYWFFVVCRFLVGFSIGEFALAEMQGLGSSWGHRQSNAKASLWFGSDLNSCAPLIEPGGGSVSLLKVFPLTLLTLLS